MAASTACFTLDGLTGRPIEVEVDISTGMPGTVIVGLADVMVSEARDRVRSAVVNSGTSWPDHRVTINLAPSSLPKSGSHYDLAIAVAIFAAKKLVPAESLRSIAFIGELALDGRLRSTRGVLPAALAAADYGYQTVVVPQLHQAEATLVPGIKVVGASSLRAVIAALNGEPMPELPAGFAESERRAETETPEQLALSLDDVVGQPEAKIAMLVAAVGGHHLSMTGPPGVGKTMLAKRLHTLIPDLAHRASLETSAIHSIAGLLNPDAPLVMRPPFVDPHHTASAVAIVGGGSRQIKPGAMSLAHHGVLFLDEAPEFASNVLDALRQPLENGQIVVSRATQTMVFPAQFQLVLAANPCPCGYADSVGERCECSPVSRRRYAERISGPIRDRIEIHRRLGTPSRAALALAATSDPHQPVDYPGLVSAARSRQIQRYNDRRWNLNAHVPGAELRRHWPPSEAAQQLLYQYVTSHRISARAVDSVLRVAWSVADLCRIGRPGADEVTAALALRHGSALADPLVSLVAAS